jgi:hypothetical protein
MSTSEITKGYPNEIGCMHKIRTTGCSSKSRQFYSGCNRLIYEPVKGGCYFKEIEKESK